MVLAIIFPILMRRISLYWSSNLLTYISFNSLGSVLSSYNQPLLNNQPLLILLN